MYTENDLRLAMVKFLALVQDGMPTIEAQDTVINGLRKLSEGKSFGTAIDKVTEEILDSLERK